MAGVALGKNDNRVGAVNENVGHEKGALSAPF